MISPTRFYLDTRVAQGEAPLKLAIRKRGQGAFLPTGIRLLPSQWDDKAQRVTAHPQKGALNSFLGGLKFKVDNFIREMVLDGSAAPLTATQIKNIIAEQFDGRRDTTTLREYWLKASHGLSRGSLDGYASTWKNIAQYDRYAESRLLTSVNEKWVSGFVAWLQGQGLKQNTCKVYLSKVKAVLATASRDGILKSNPAEDITIQLAVTRKRNLSASQMHSLLSFPPSSELERSALDFFSLSFFLRAANPADIVRLTFADIFNGRLEYDRAKTGKHYSVRIVSEAQDIIDRYSDGVHLFSISKYKDYKSFLVAMDKTLNRISVSIGLPKVSLYWARHTFASLAFELGYPMDIVSAALGHSLGGAPVTSVYVAIQDYKVDELARAVYDAVK